jgi:hypothetical protein
MKPSHKPRRVPGLINYKKQKEDTMRRGMFLTALIIVVGLVILPMAADACPKCPDRASGKEQKKSLKEKFCKKTKFILQHKEMLGLTDDQHQKIKALKAKTKKYLIMKTAEVEVIVMDIQSELYNDPINVEAVTVLNDKKYDIKKQKANTLVQALADLKNILTEKQKAKIKAAFHKNSSSQCGMDGYGNQCSKKVPRCKKTVMKQCAIEAKESK